MTYDWKALAPTHALGPAEIAAGNLYAERHGEGAMEIDALLNAGLEPPIAIFGPAGAGKSTELAALANRRQTQWIGCLIRLDKELIYTDKTSVDDVLEAIGKSLALRALDELHLPLSAGLAQAIGRGNPQVRIHSFLKGRDLLLNAIREIRSRSPQGSVGLLMDGLEKAPPELARKTLEELESLRGEARVVVVVPTGLATGPAADALQDFQLISIGPSQVSPYDLSTGFPVTSGDHFLVDIAARRLGTQPDQLGMQPRNNGGSSDNLRRAIRSSVVWSGGLIRTFLQLLQKGALYARMRGLQAPEEEDIARAARDQSIFLLRLLKEGDIKALLLAHGTTGVEVEINRRVRFLSHGLLLEYRTPKGPLVQIAPLLVGEILKTEAHD